jgi:hypothetical protein
MSARSAAAELAKLARVLGRPVADLSVLAGVPAEDLRVLREQIADAVFGPDRAAFERVAATARMLPASVAAPIAQAVLPPVLAARVAELLEPRQAVELAARLSDRYLADVATELDPARVATIVPAIPAPRVGAVTRELGRRAEWAIIAAFVPHLSPDGLGAAAAALDGEQVLRVGFVVEDVVEDGTALGRLAGLLTDAQIDQLLAAAATQALWGELDAVVTALPAETAARCAARFAAAPARLRAAVDRAVAAEMLSRAARARLGAA